MTQKRSGTSTRYPMRTRASRSQGWPALVQELLDFLWNPWGSTALLLGVALPWGISIILLGTILFALFLDPFSVDKRLFNLALLFLIFMTWVSVVDLGIILFVYFLRDPLYEYQRSWPVRKRRQPGIVQLAGVAFVAFLVLALLAALLPLIWSTAAPDVELFGLTEQYFWHGILVAFLLSMSIASFVLFLMLLDTLDYVAWRDKHAEPPIYMDIDRLLKKVLDKVHEYLAVESSTILSMQRTELGGLHLLLSIPLEISEGKKNPRYEVESDKWGALASLKEKGD